MNAACLVRAKEPPLPWQDQAPWRGVPVRSSESGLRLLQMLEATDESPRKASLLVIGAPDRDVAELLESLENKEGWRDGLRGASRVDQHFLLAFGDARSLAAAARVLEDDLCRVIVVDDRLDDVDEDDHAVRELPTCASCFDRLDLDDDDDREPRKPNGSCATCRVMMHPSTARCVRCNDSKHIWACLVCGELGCGRYAREHAKDHAAATGHGFALEAATGRVWDYHGDRFAHRVRGSRRSSGEISCRRELPQLKLRSLADRYERVLCERLEEQRRFYEERLRALPPPPPRDDGALTQACDRAKAAAAAWAARAALADAKLRATRATHERLRRAAALSKAKAAAGRAAAADVRHASRSSLAEAKAQLADIEFACRARRELSTSEAAGGAVVGVAAAPEPPPRRGKKKGRRRSS